MRSRILTFVALAAIGIFGYFWYEDFWDRYPVERINSRQASGSPTLNREFIFRAKSIRRDYRDESVTREWRLKVPSNFVFSEIGSNGALEPRELIVRFLYQVDPVTLEVKYQSIMEPHQMGWVVIYATLHNMAGLGAREFLNKDYCLDYEDKRNMFGNDQRGRYKEPRPEVRDCSTPNCELVVSYHGWRVGANVPREVYVEKEKYCTQIRSLLDKWTTSIEGLLP